MQRDLLNRIKYERGVAQRGPELNNLLPRVNDKFVKLGEILFADDDRPPYEHPKITAAREAEEAKISTKKKKKKVQKEQMRDQFEPITLALPLTGREKLGTLDSTLITKPDTMISLSCYSRPENFAQKLKDIEIPFPSNDIDRKTEKQIAAAKLAKLKQGQKS